MSRAEAYYAVMHDVGEVDLRGRPVPSDLALIGDEAFPLVMNPRGQVLIAASTYRTGRLVALGHEDMLTACAALVENALVWLNPCSGIVGINPSCKGILTNLSYTNIRSEVGGFREGLGAYVTDAYSVGENVKELVAFLKAGGGLLVAGQAWEWAEQHPKENPLLGFPGNKVCSVAGIYFTELKGERGVFSVPHHIPSSWLAVAIDKDYSDDLEILLQGVSEFDVQCSATPSEVMIHGPLAFPITTDDAHRAFFAGSYYGQGRVIVTTHESYISRPALGTFLVNAIRWLDEGRNGEVGILPKLKAASDVLGKSGLKCTLTDFRDDLSVYVCTSYSDEHAAEIQEFVAEGGGLLIGGHGWNWAQKNKGRNVLTEYPGNHILNKLGFSILGNFLRPGKYKAPEPSTAYSEYYHFRNMLKRFAGHVTKGNELKPHELNFLKRLGGDCASFLRMEALDQHSYRSVLDLLADIVKNTTVPQVSQTSPVKDPKDHLLISMCNDLYKVCPNRDELLGHIIHAKPSLAVMNNVAVKIDGKAPGGLEWKSTGLYLSPGMKTYMRFPAEMVNKGWRVQIGCQTDFVGNAAVLKRAPVVHHQFDIDSEMMEVYNLWGGLIYFVAPDKSTAGELKILVQQAVMAPYYKSGVTTVEDWVKTIRNAPAPWAEMEFENIIITCHSTTVRDVERPDEVAALWDEIMRAVADLGSNPQKFLRKERYVADVQISHGLMHCGYPIMMHAPSAINLMKPDVLRESGCWGAIHELGHNQQRGAWEFPPHTTECTCNLWSVYVFENVFGIERGKAHKAIAPAKRKAVREAFKKNPDLAKWSVFTALETYLQLQEEFGWEPFKKVFAAYQGKKNVPRAKDAKMSLFAEMFSRTVERNLTPFFKAWAWPITADTEKKLADLPEWTDHPMS
ncbi:hypothetical protein GJAV_G00052220 [Gymnothorax javanicus]|nr:hypothetical protein GJAV_G00052220 [Gymnothorax javanicus]